MKVVNMGNIADAFKFDDLPATGIVIEATPEELKLLPNLAYKDVTISEHVGNAAKMREALSDACYAMFNFLKTQNGGYEEMAKALDKAKATLAEPPRNCDLLSKAEVLEMLKDRSFSKEDTIEWLYDEAKGETK